jgi:uncharacterized phage-associated protein
MFEKEKISNLIVYLSSRIDKLYITKFLKLIYLIDETSVKHTGVPVFDLDYKVWQFGPVNTEIYYKLLFNISDFTEYFTIQENKFGKIITSNSDFDDSEFSEYELSIIDEIIEEYGHLSASKLVKILHKKDSLWYKIVKEKKLESIFEYERTSPFSIDFSELIKEQPNKKAMYDLTAENRQFINSVFA